MSPAHTLLLCGGAVIDAIAASIATLLSCWAHALLYSRRTDEVEPEGACPQNLELRWMSEVASSVYATPLITDLFSDGHKDIVVPSFVHHLEVRFTV